MHNPCRQVVQFSPPLADTKQIMINCLKEIVENSQNFPRCRWNDVFETGSFFDWAGLRRRSFRSTRRLRCSFWR